MHQHALMLSMGLHLLVPPPLAGMCCNAGGLRIYRWMLVVNTGPGEVMGYYGCESTSLDEVRDKLKELQARHGTDKVRTR
jgi:hypothetical protein